MEVNKFRTKTGYCHILGDRIVLMRDGIAKNIAKVALGNNIYRIIILYSLISIFLFYFAFKYFKEGKIASTVFNSFLGLFFIYKIKQSLNYSAISIIERDRIKEVKFMNAKFGAIRSAFEIVFENTHGKLKKSLILLLGSLDNETLETEKALEIMKNKKVVA
jgi:hypothetical protein